MIQRLKELMLRPSNRAVDWTKEERQSFLLFSRSLAGKKLLEFLRQYASSVTFNAVRNDRVEQNAYARGVQDVVFLVTRLSSVLDGEAESFGEPLEPLPSQREQYFPRGNFSGI